MEKTTYAYKSITPTRLYTVCEAMRIMKCSRANILGKITSTANPLRYVVDGKTKRMKIEGSELIRYFKLKE